MRIFVSVDMEGISGVTRWADVVKSGQDYERARRWLTADVNAAVAGARAAGATDFVVEENHGTEMLCNVLLDEIDPEVEVVRGQPRGGATTMSALDDSFDAVFLVGHHASSSDYPGVCAHTISHSHYKEVRLDGRPLTEGEMFALAAAQRGVPTALITGDDVVTAILQKVCPGIEMAVVKRALSREAAAIIPPVRAQRIIHDAARRAVERLRAGEIDAPEPHPPFAIEVELRESISKDIQATIAQRFPEFTVNDDRVFSFAVDEMAVGFRMAAIVQALAETPERVRSY
ncbi:MAG TPA: M55 family metallopeptidase [Acidimicrobiia bacterium]|nr:M55 family metallopeptidase [Acidimicrobiia bacterium]